MCSCIVCQVMHHIGILGAGGISDTHARAAAALPNVRVSAVCGTNAAKVEALANRYGAAAFTDVAAFLAHKPMDIVAIGSPSGLHADQGVMAAAAGLHLYVEKPLDVTTAKADALIDAAARAGVQIAVCFQDRNNPRLSTVKQWIDGGVIGEPRLVSARVKWYRPPEYYAQSKWRGTPALDGGGALMNQGIHTVDLLLWWLGDIVRVSAKIRHAGPPDRSRRHDRRLAGIRQRRDRHAGSDDGGVSGVSAARRGDGHARDRERRAGSHRRLRRARRAARSRGGDGGPGRRPERPGRVGDRQRRARASADSRRSAGRDRDGTASALRWSRRPAQRRGRRSAVRIGARPDVPWTCRGSQVSHGRSRSAPTSRSRTITTTITSHDHEHPTRRDVLKGIGAAAAAIPFLSPESAEALQQIRSGAAGSKFLVLHARAARHRRRAQRAPHSRRRSFARRARREGRGLHRSPRRRIAPPTSRRPGPKD